MAANEEIWRKFQELKAQDAKLLFEDNNIVTAADFFEWCVDQNRDNLAVKAVDSDLTYTYGQLDEAANKVAHWARSSHFEAGQKVALLMENRPEYLVLTMGLAKIGITIALINTNITENLLAQAVITADAKCIIVSSRLHQNWRSASPFFRKRKQDNDGYDQNAIPVCWWFGEVADLASKNEYKLDVTVGYFPNTRPSRDVRQSVKSRDPLYYIYTSGTTGPSKAALFSNLRFIGCALTWKRPCGLTSNDKYYVTLPLYHGNGGCVAVAAAYFAGATIVLRQKFSASGFFRDIREHQCTVAAYIGELWRYLQIQPVSDQDKDHTLRVIVGNGLRAHIWEEITKRFNIQLVVEHYGSTEMPGDAILNYFNRVGSCGYVPKAVWAEREAKIIQFDVIAEQAVRNKDGFCIECRPDEPGEIVFKLPGGSYDGYVGKEATTRKLYHDVFVKDDTWWSSGDLLKIDSDGFFYFVDRTGDSFRWKGENTSTTDVCNVLLTHSAVKEANVYGVVIPNTDGKAGMASITLIPSEQTEATVVESISSHLAKSLPKYARPLFLRINQKEHDKTSTFKFEKHKYAQAGFDPNLTAPDSVYFNNNGTVVRIDDNLHQQIVAGRFSL